MPLLPDDAAIVARDAVLGQRLASVLEDDRLLELLRQRYPEQHIASVRGNYIRYKPATSCIIGFEAQSPGGSALCGYAKALPDRVEVHHFPEDATLSKLVAIEDSEFWRKVLRDQAPSDPNELRVERIAYKPERRFVAQVRDRDDLPIAAAKFYARGSFSRALANARGVRSSGPLRIPKRLGKSHHHSAIATQWIDATPLATREQLEPPSSDSMERIGRALAALHAQSSDTIGLLTPSLIESQLRAMPALIDAIAPHCAAMANRLVDQLIQLVHASTSAGITIHGDFYANQILIDDDHVTIVDTDEIARGPASFDLGNFIAHWFARIDCAGVSDAQLDKRVLAMRDTMLAGYRAAGGTDISDLELNLHTAVGCVKLAGRAFRLRDPGWGSAVERILRRAQRFAEQLPRVAPVMHRRVGATMRIDDALGAMKDRVLSSVLSIATDPTHIVPELRRRVSELADRELRAIRITRHKHNRRCLIEYDFAGSFTVIGKVRAKGVDAAQAAVYQSIYDSGFSDSRATDGILVPRPLGAIPSMHMTLQQKVAGVAVSQMLHDFAGADARLGSRVADAIVKLHAANVTPLRRHTVEDELRILEADLTNAAQARPDCSESIARITEDCIALAKPLFERTRTCGIHRDLYPDQVLLAGARVYLLDFDLYCVGDPALDAGNYIAHVIDQSIRTCSGDPARFEAHCRDFLEIFVAHHGDAIRDAIEIYTTISLARLVAISTRIADRGAWTKKLVSVTRRRLDRSWPITELHGARPEVPGAYDT